MGSKETKDAQLGMSERAASVKLVRSWLFQLLQEIGKDFCHRCSKRIETVAEFSTDHKEPWLHVSTDLYWDVSNLAASHRKCNSGARRSRPRTVDRRTSSRKKFAKMYSDPVKREKWLARRRELYALKRGAVV